MRTSILAERTSTELPAPPTALVQHPWRVAFEALAEAQVGRVSTDEPLHWLLQHLLPAPVDQQQAPFGIEGEHRRIDLRHDRTQEGHRFEGAKPLAAEHLGQAVASM